MRGGIEPGVDDVDHLGSPVLPAIRDGADETATPEETAPSVTQDADANTVGSFIEARQASAAPKPRPSIEPW